MYIDMYTYTYECRYMNVTGLTLDAKAGLEESPSLALAVAYYRVDYANSGQELAPSTLRTSSYI